MCLLTVRVRCKYCWFLSFGCWLKNADVPIKLRSFRRFFIWLFLVEIKHRWLNFFLYWLNLRKIDFLVTKQRISTIRLTPLLGLFCSFSLHNILQALANFKKQFLCAWNIMSVQILLNVGLRIQNVELKINDFRI